MKILVLYATYSGGTQTAADIVANVLKTNATNQVEMKTPTEITPNVLSGYDMIIVGSPSWDYEGKTGMPHQDFINFIDQSKTVDLTGKKVAVFGLGDSTYERFCGAVEHLEEWVKGLKAQLSTESLKIDGFFFNQEVNTEKLKAWAQKLL